MQTEAVFENIAERIQQEISKAQNSVFIAVAWFTNKNIFDTILSKAKNGCAVSLIISNDEINANSQIIFSELEKGNFFKTISDTIYEKELFQTAAVVFLLSLARAYFSGTFQDGWFFFLFFIAVFCAAIAFFTKNKIQKKMESAKFLHELSSSNSENSKLFLQHLLEIKNEYLRLKKEDSKKGTFLSKKFEEQINLFNISKILQKQANGEKDVIN